MTQRRFLLIALLTLVVGTVSIQTQGPAAQDVRSLLQAVAKNTLARHAGGRALMR